jgi:subtilisin family serine protease
MRSRVGAVLSILFLLTVIAVPAAADQTYVLGASKWGAAQNKAVAAAGGVVTFSHARAGFAIATSDNPDFLAAVLQSKVITEGVADEVVRFQDPVTTYEIEENWSNPPKDETFFNFIQWAPQAIDAPAAWAAGCTGQGVRVAVLDGGIHNTHVDLVANLDVARSTSFVPGFAFNQDIGTFWHGTHVAGIVAAAENGIGTIGIAPNATIIGVKVLHDGSGSFSGVFAGILYAATPIAEGGAGADVLNLSLGTIPFRRAPQWGPFRSFMNRVMNYAHQRGALVVIAAGNDSFDFDHSGNYTVVPAEAPNVVAVSATGPEGFALGATNFERPASYTNFGTSVIDVAAPGGDFALPGDAVCSLPRVPSGSVTTYCWVFDMVMSTTRGSVSSVSSYGFAAGTSMAAPAAAAVAALIKGANPGISVAQLRAKLQQSATDEGKPGTDPYYGKGWVNALNACIW